MIQAYTNYWIGFADFGGRVNVREYWLALLSHLAANVILAIVLAFVLQSDYSYVSTGLISFQLLSMVPFLAISARRLNDAGYAQTNLFWILLPIDGAIILILILCKPSVYSEGEHHIKEVVNNGSTAGYWMIGSGVLLMVGTLITMLPFIHYGLLGQMEVFWWISKVSIFIFSLMLLLNVKNSLLLIPSGIVTLTNLKSALFSFSIIGWFKIIAWGAVFGLIVQVILLKKSITKDFKRFPAGMFLALVIYTVFYEGFDQGTLNVVVANLLNAAAFHCFGNALTEDMDKGFNESDNVINSFASIPASDSLFNTSSDLITKNEKVPGILLVRFSIDKLNNFGGSYDYQAGKLIAEAVPSALLEGMTISDGDSAGTVSGQERVYLVAIASDNISILQKKIEPLLIANKEIIENGDIPVIQVVTTADETMVLDGVVKNGKIIGSGGWCATGFMDGWKQT